MIKQQCPVCGRQIASEADPREAVGLIGPFRRHVRRLGDDGTVCPASGKMPTEAAILAAKPREIEAAGEYCEDVDCYRWVYPTDGRVIDGRVYCERHTAEREAGE